MWMVCRLSITMWTTSNDVFWSALDCHACTVLDLVGQVGVVGLTHGLHPHLEFCGLRLILVPCDRNSCHVV